MINANKLNKFNTQWLGSPERQVLNSTKGSQENLLREVIFKLQFEVCQVDKKKRLFLINITYKGENRRRLQV